MEEGVGRQLLWFYGVGVCMKVQLIPAYHSTDLEVHRNWLAITHSLPLSKWYTDETSPWTLDYPPFFAFFEFFMSFAAALVDPRMVHLVEGLDYGSETVVYFQRLSVILSDLVLLFGVYRLTKGGLLESWKKRVMLWVLVVWSPGLVIVDHLHFQYNGFLLGMLMLSISYLVEGRDLMGGFVFAVLLCFKHLFAVAAPVYFVYLLRHYCWKGFVKGFGRLLAMGSAVVAVFAIAYGPFLYYGQIQQVLRRMFPFGRGLCHAFWAPNFWVFYIMLDKGIAFLFQRLGFEIPMPTASFTGGLVGDASPFAVLPQVTPMVTFIMVLLSLSPCLVKAWKNPQKNLLPSWIAYAYTCGFMFGWHVHEKASLHFIIPLAIVAVQSSKDARHYFILSIACCYSLFPLLYEAQEYPIKVLLLLVHSILMWCGFSIVFTKDESTKMTTSSKNGGFKIGWVGRCYLLGLMAVEVWGQFLHPYIFGEKLPFVPLLIISVYCALAISYSWILQLTCIITS